LGAFAVLAQGCQSATVQTSVTAKFSDNTTDSQLSFWHELADRHVTSNDDAFHGLLLYVDSHDNSKTYDDRVAALKAKGLLSSSFSQPADLAVTRGTLAVAICKLLHLRGGIMMHITGPIPRYAVKELVYDGIFPPSSPQQTFSGTEFVGIIGKLDDYQSASAEVAAQ
jgi:hypothetical protein